MRKKHSGNTYWIYGWHATLAALSNPKRHIHALWISDNGQRRFEEAMGKKPRITPTIVKRNEQFHTILPTDAVHQGIAMEVSPLPTVALEDIVPGTTQTLVMLDQVSDPHNVGAILRTAAAFGAAAVIVHDHHAPKETAVMAKASSGALETVPLAYAGNLSKALDYVKKHGYWCIGLDGHTDKTIAQHKIDAPTVLVMGAEGKGLRPLVKEHCDLLVKIPIDSTMESLNVSNATAVALYEITRDATKG